MLSRADTLWIALVAAAAASTAGVAPEARAQDIHRPGGAKRIVRVFDFEEKPMNPEPVPMHWFRAQNDPPERVRPGFPPWNAPAFDASFHASGSWSVRTPTQGGSTSLRLSSGVIPAIPGADYLVAAMVRTDGLVHARARLTARCLNERREPVEGSERSSEPTDTRGEWKRVTVKLPGEFPSAAWVQIDLELLQPRQLGEFEMGSEAARVRETMLEDVAGAAWFDDVQVDLLPRVDLAIDAASGVVVGPAGPVFSALIRDLTGERVRGRLTAYDVDGGVLATIDFPAPAGRERFTWKPALAEYGWGRAILEAITDAGVIASASKDFVWLPPPPPIERAPGVRAARYPEAGRFVIVAEDLGPESMGALPSVLRATGAGAAHLAVWDSGLTKAVVRLFTEELETAVERVIDEGASLTLTLAHTPHEFAKAARLDPDASPLEALARPPEPGAPDWRDYLGDALSKFGQRVRRWQIGKTGEPKPFWRDELAMETAAAQAAFARLVPRPLIALPWSIEQGLDARIASDRSLTIVIPWESPASSIPDALAALGVGARAQAEDTVVLETPPESMFGGRAVAEDLVKRAVLAWSAAPGRIAIQRPFDPLPTGGASPHAALSAWRQVVQRLGGRVIAGELPVAPGARCFILDGPRAGALVGWTDWADPDDTTIEMFLGSGSIVAIDPFGNETPVPLSDGSHRLALTPTPTFVEGINVELARFRAGFALDPPSLPAEAALHSAELVLHNPWPVAIGGTLRIVEPAQWKIEPRVFSFDIPAGGEQRLPMDLSFGVAEESGVKRVIAEADIVADDRYPRVRLSAPLEIGQAGLALTPSYAFLADDAGAPRDVGLTLSITNNGAETVSLKVFALAPGYPRQEATVSALTPGQSAVRRFSFPGGVQRLIGQRVRVGAAQVGGAERINKSMLIQ